MDVLKAHFLFFHNRRCYLYFYCTWLELWLLELCFAHWLFEAKFFTGPKLNYVENQDLTVVFNYSTTSKYLLLILVDMTITILCISITYWRSGFLSINYTIYMVLKRRYHSDCTYQKKSSPSFGLQSWLDVS